LVGDVADDRFEHWSEGRSDGGEFVELAGTGSADFDDNDEGEGLAACVLLEGELLWDAVVVEDEVFGGEGEDEISGFAADECGNEDQSRACAE
jgi:hypothetical protein